MNFHEIKTIDTIHTKFVFLCILDIYVNYSYDASGGK